MAKMVPTAAALAECPDGYDASKPPAQKSENVSSLMSTGNVDDVSGSGLSRSTPHFTYPVISVVNLYEQSYAEFAW